MGTSWPVARRLTQLGNPTLKQLERAAAALGKKLVLTLR
jgi:antitoxin HicB